MENMINFGIDLGTTNSSIAKFIKGEIKVFKNPNGWKDTIPSIIGFKKDKIIVGEQAKTYLEKEPKNVLFAFKRKMGTSETFKIKSIKESKSPIELSAIVLKELKTFLPPDENIESVVITIPASFDIIQSNATKEAGMQAGFKQVILLQEPIAASLAFANMKKEKELKDGMWLVYDLGGGTFDVALIKIKDGEMKVIDHEGDNFLGGTDFDRLIIEKFIIPKMDEKYSFDELENSMKSASGKFNKQYYSLLKKAEEAKILLSSKTSAEIIVDGIADENNIEIDEEFTITRTELNEILKEHIDNTIEMIKKIISRNSLKSNDILFTLMVGGSTYIPYVRNRVEEILQIPNNCEIDPTTAVTIGAAYFASTKSKEINKNDIKKSNLRISIKAAYQKISKENEELFSARITGDIADLSYRIKREDGGYDSGLKKLEERINEDLPLVNDAFNFFKLTIYDSLNNIVETDLDMIGINSGYGISGQPLPEDVCLEVDDEELSGETKLELAFQKNSILPLKKTFNKVLNKTIIKGSADDIIRVKVLEGPQISLPEANKIIGYMELTGENISRDVHKGSDIEISLQISESRDLSISVYLNMASQEFKETFVPKSRHTTVNLIQIESEKLLDKLDFELEEAENNEDFETVNDLNKLKPIIVQLNVDALSLTDDDVTDSKYQIEDKKRKLAQEIDNAIKDKRIVTAKNDYFDAKNKCEEMVSENGNDIEHKHLKDITSQEQIFLNSSNPIKIIDKKEELNALYYSILWRMPNFLISLFKDLSHETQSMNDLNQAKSLVDAGRFAIESESWERLTEINYALINLIPKSKLKEAKTKIGF